MVSSRNPSTLLTLEGLGSRRTAVHIVASAAQHDIASQHLTLLGTF